MKIACTLMQRNEKALLEHWIRYHANLFGYENLFIFDNGSDDQSVKETLRTYADLGVNVSYQYSQRSDFTRKGKIIGDFLGGLQDRAQYDVGIPLDCDEFLVLKTAEGATCNPSSVREYLDKTVHAGTGSLRIDTQLFNIIHSPGSFAFDHWMKTVVVLDGSFMGIDDGFHNCQMADGVDYRPSQLALVHYHFKPLAMLREHARAKLSPYVDVDDPVALANYNGPSASIIGYLNMSESEHSTWHGQGDFYRFNEFHNVLELLGLSDPFKTS